MTRQHQIILRLTLLLVICFSINAQAQVNPTLLTTSETQNEPYKYVGSLYGLNNGSFGASAVTVGSPYTILTVAHLVFNGTWASTGYFRARTHYPYNPTLPPSVLLRGFYYDVSYANYSTSSGSGSAHALHRDIAAAFSYEKLQPDKSYAPHFNNPYNITNGIPIMMLGVPKDVINGVTLAMFRTGSINK